VGPGWLLATYLAAAFAFWVKGPIGVVSIGGPLALDALFARRWHVVLSPVHLVGLPMLAALCAAWPLVLQHVEGEAAARTFLLNNGWYRIAPEAGAGQYSGGHENPFWYYPPRVFGQLGFVTLFAPAAAVWLWRGATPPGWRLPALRFLAWVFPLGVLLLSIPGTKRSLYLLPFEPPLAVAIGAWIAAVARDDRHRSRVEVAVNTLCAQLLGALSPVAARLGRAGARIAPDLRADVARAGSGACRAPYRVAALAFAIAIAWNAIGLRFEGHDRDLGPMSRAVAERVGAGPLVVFWPEERVLGALPFYTGRIPVHSREIDRLAPLLAQSHARFLLAPLSMRDPIAAALGNRAVLEASWEAAGDEYGLFAVSPEVTASLPPGGSPGPIRD
jgi:4-amino-4-deoxy-L-arabinose transferase-like glycosyltransferase